MDPNEKDGLQSELEGMLERHGDEAADEIVRTIRTTRRVSLAMFAVFGVVFLVVAGLIVWMIIQMGSSPTYP